MSAPKAIDRAAMRKAAGKCFEVYKKMVNESPCIPVPLAMSLPIPAPDAELAAIFKFKSTRPSKKKKNKAPEGEVVHACLELLHLAGIFAWRNNTGAVNIGSRFVKYGKKGSADIIGMLKDGRFLAIECKSDTGVQSPAQKLFQMQVEKNNGLYCLVTSAAELTEKLHVKP